MDQVYNAYLAEVRQAIPADPDEAAAFVAETLVDRAFDLDGDESLLRPVDRHRLVDECCQGSPEDPIPPLSRERVESVLAELQQRGPAEVAGDQITVPDRFLPAGE